MIGPKKRNLPRSQWDSDCFRPNRTRCDEKARNPKVTYIIGPWRQEFWVAKKTGSASSSLASALGITSGNRGPDFPEIASLFVADLTRKATETSSWRTRVLARSGTTMWRRKKRKKCAKKWSGRRSEISHAANGSGCFRPNRTDATKKRETRKWPI